MQSTSLYVCAGDYKMTGLGISEGGGVIGADIMLLHQQENGKWVVSTSRPEGTIEASPQ
jgi:hypothetical protein